MEASSTLLDTDAELCSLVGTGNLDRAAIFNTQGTSVWASSPGFTVCRQFLLRLSIHLLYIRAKSRVFLGEDPVEGYLWRDAKIDDPVRSRLRKSKRSLLRTQTHQT